LDKDRKEFPLNVSIRGQKSLKNVDLETPELIGVFENVEQESLFKGNIRVEIHKGKEIVR